MLTIRKEQLKVFEVKSKEEFDLMVLKHINEFFPEEVERIDKTKLKDLIDYIIQRAKIYGLISERDLLKYINLSMIYGKDFDLDPNLLWMKKILDDKEERNPSIKMKKLYREAEKRLEEESLK